MDIVLTDQFKKNFKKRILRNTHLLTKYRERIALFIQNTQNPLLHTHVLKGKMREYRSFSITGDVRVIYIQQNKTTILFVDIGTHTQVYGM